MKKILLALSLLGLLSVNSFSAEVKNNNGGKDMVKTERNNFYKSDKVTIQKVKFKNQYGMELVANLVVPKNIKANEKLPAIVIGHPLGAVKEQASTLYAQKLAEQGFITLAIDAPFWGESEGRTRQAVEPTLYSEAFSAGVDFLSSQKNVDKNNIAALGICASGGFVIDAAKIDPRIKAVATISMVEIGTATRMGATTPEARQQMIKEASEQRNIEYAGGKIKYTGGTTDKIAADTPQIQKDFYDFYRTPRGKVVPAGASDETITKPTLSSNVKLLNFYPFIDIETISPRPMLFIAGANAESKGFSEQAYKLAAEPKELYIVPNAGHVDMYDDVAKIPFDKLTDFYKKNLK